MSVRKDEACESYRENRKKLCCAAVTMYFTLIMYTKPSIDLMINDKKAKK